MGPKKVAYTSLLLWMQEVMEKLGFAQEHARTVATVLAEADVRGIDSHGVARLSGYIKLIEKGRIHPGGNPQWVREKASVGLLDAQAQIGAVAGQMAMEKAIEKCRNTGAAWIFVRNSNHYGIAGYYTEMAVKEGFIGLSGTNASPLVTPAGSKERMLGTNPLSIAFPTGDEAPVIIDMASSAASNGKLEIASRKGKSIPLGWAVDAEGKGSSDPDVLKQGGALLPLGSKNELGVHKGYALSAGIDLLSGVVSGAGFGPWVPPFVAFLDPVPGPAGPGIGHFFGCIDPEAIQERSQYERYIKDWRKRFKQAQPARAGQGVLVPGDPERETKNLRIKEGIPLEGNIWSQIEDISVNFKVWLNT